MDLLEVVLKHPNVCSAMAGILVGKIKLTNLSAKAHTTALFVREMRGHWKLAWSPLEEQNKPRLPVDPPVTRSTVSTP